MTTTGEKIAQLRKQQGLTQAKLAQAAGLSASSIAMYETNRRQPDAETTLKVAKALNVDPEVLTIPTEEHSLNSEAVQEVEERSDNDATTQSSNTQDASWTTLTLSKEEARLILYIRMHPEARPFLQKFLEAEPHQRAQLEKAWRLIQAFQA